MSNKIANFFLWPSQNELREASFENSLTCHSRHLNIFFSSFRYCLSEFEQLTTCDHLLRVMIDSFPLLNSLTQVNLAYVASDKLLYLIAKYCRKLEELNVDHCHQVTDRGVKMLAGNGKSSTTVKIFLDTISECIRRGAQSFQLIWQFFCILWPAK